MHVFLEKAMDAAERNALPGSQFGIPETRSFPLSDAPHVRNAIARFGMAPAGKKAGLAKRILAAAKRHGVEVESEDILRRAK